MRISVRACCMYTWHVCFSILQVQRMNNRSCIVQTASISRIQFKVCDSVSRLVSDWLFFNVHRCKLFITCKAHPQRRRALVHPASPVPMDCTIVRSLYPSTFEHVALSMTGEMNSTNFTSLYTSEERFSKIRFRRTPNVSSFLGRGCVNISESCGLPIWVTFRLSTPFAGCWSSCYARRFVPPTSRTTCAVRIKFSSKPTCLTDDHDEYVRLRNQITSAKMKLLIRYLSLSKHRLNAVLRMPSVTQHTSACYKHIPNLPNVDLLKIWTGFDVRFSSAS